jgi:hypothetical protein
MACGVAIGEAYGSPDAFGRGHLSDQGGCHSYTAAIRKVPAHEEIEQAALHVSGVAGEQSFRFQRLPHFLDHHGEESGFEFLGRLL